MLLNVSMMYGTALGSHQFYCMHNTSSNFIYLKIIHKIYLHESPKIA